MACYLITYDLNNETTRPNILGTIKSYNWARLSESSYAIETAQSVETVYVNLSRHLDTNDFCYVISLVRPYKGFGLNAVNEWLERYLPY